MSYFNTINSLQEKRGFFMKKYMIMFALLAFAPIAAKVQEINSEKEFYDAIAHGVSVVKFYAPGCPSCKGALHTFEQLSKEHSNIHFISVDANDYQQLKEKYGVPGFPTFVYFKDGRDLGKKHSGMTDGLKSKIEANLASIK